MFSLNALQVRKALKGLYETPQNNFCVALNGVNIYSGNKCSVRDKVELNKSIKDFFLERFEFPTLTGENEIEILEGNVNESKNENRNVNYEKESDEDEDSEEEEEEGEVEEEEEEEGKEERGGEERKERGGGEVDEVEVDVAQKIRKLREERKYQLREEEGSGWIAIDESIKKEDEKIKVAERQCIRNDQSSKLLFKQRRMTDFFMGNAVKAVEKTDDIEDENGNGDDNDYKNKRAYGDENRIVSSNVNKNICDDVHKDEDGSKDRRKDRSEDNVTLFENKNKNKTFKNKNMIDNKIMNNKKDMSKDDVTEFDCLLDMLENILLSEDALGQVLRFQNLDLLDVEGMNDQRMFFTSFLKHVI